MVVGTTVAVAVGLCGVIVCAVHQAFTRDTAWACAVVAVVAIEILDRGSAYSRVLFAKIVAGMMHTQVVPDFVVYPLDVVYMIAATGVLDRRSARRSSRHVALVCTATSCIVVARHSNVVSQPMYIVACRLAMYVGCAVYSGASEWAAVIRSIWILNVHPWLLSLALVQLYAFARRAPQKRRPVSQAQPQAAQVVWTASGPMEV